MYYNYNWNCNNLINHEMHFDCSTQFIYCNDYLWKKLCFKLRSALGYTKNYSGLDSFNINILPQLFRSCNLTWNCIAQFSFFNTFLRYSCAFINKICILSSVYCSSSVPLGGIFCNLYDNKIELYIKTLRLLIHMRELWHWILFIC